MTFKSTIETLSGTLSEAELDGVAGGMIKQPRPERPPVLPVLSLATSLSKPRRGSPRTTCVPHFKSRTRQATKARCELAAGFFRLLAGDRRRMLVPP
jgi:hypothetical protein